MCEQSLHQPLNPWDDWPKWRENPLARHHLASEAHGPLMIWTEVLTLSSSVLFAERGTVLFSRLLKCFPAGETRLLPKLSHPSVHWLIYPHPSLKGAATAFFLQCEEAFNAFSIEQRTELDLKD